MAAKTDPPPEQTLYWRGDRARYTGVSDDLYGETAYEIVLLEGHLKGQKKWTYRSPK